MDTNDTLMLILSELKDIKSDVSELKQDVKEIKKHLEKHDGQLAAIAEAINIVQHNEQEHFKILNNKDSELENVAKQNSYDIAELRLKAAQ